MKMKKLTHEEMLDEFKLCMAMESVKKKVDFPMGEMTLNGKFHHFVDSDTDSAWIGFVVGMNRLTQLINSGKVEEKTDENQREAGNCG